MPIVVFNATSKRIGDIELKAGCSIGELRNMLAAGGYDVRSAQAAVIRFQGTKLYGAVDEYVLHDGDIVEFETCAVSCKATEAWLKDACKPCCCRAPSGDSAPESESRTVNVTVNGTGVAAVPEDGGCVTIRIVL